MNEDIILYVALGLMLGVVVVICATRALHHLLAPRPASRGDIPPYLDAPRYQ